MQQNKYLRIPYGLTDFGDIRLKGYYYVDKTRFIRQLENDGSFIFMLRPRRFGKSLFMAVLDYYYNVKYADRFEAIFSGLDIGRNPTPERSSYQVLKFNFSGVNPGTEKVLASFNNEVNITLQKFAADYAEMLPIETLATLRQYRDSDQAFTYLMNQAEFAGMNIYLMIDEYDNFANTLMSMDEDGYTTLTHGDGYFRLFFNIVKKATTGAGSPIKRIFITGVTPLTLSDVTSGFNIGLNLSMDGRYNEMVGFTEGEVREMLCYYRDATGCFRHTVDELIDTMKPWYDSNCFSIDSVDSERMFNSDMTLYFITKYIARGGQFPDPMIDPNVSTDYNKVASMVKYERGFGEKTGIMQRILNEGQTLTEMVSEFTLQDLARKECLRSMLYYMGMLTYGKDAQTGRVRLVVPNAVVREQYYRYMKHVYETQLRWRADDDVMAELGINMAEDGDGLPLIRYIASCLTTDSSNRDFDPQAEAFVKGFMLAHLGGRNNYFCTMTERELNHGYSDILMLPMRSWGHAFIIELKYVDHHATDEAIRKVTEQAQAQLARYVADHQLQQQTDQKGWTLHRYCVVFSGWELRVCEETI